MDTFLYTIQKPSTGEVANVYMTKEEASRCAVDFNFAMGIINRSIEESATSTSADFINEHEANMQHQQTNDMERTAQLPPGYLRGDQLYSQVFASYNIPT